MAPDYPIVCTIILFLDAFSNFLDSFYHIALLKLCKGPVLMCVVTIAVLFFGLFADVYGFTIELVHVV